MSDGRPWLSILLPVYGVDAYLGDCARSLLGQIVDGVELVFVDDASPDGSGSQLAALQAERPDCVRVLTHASNQGISAARNTLLDAARGDYLWFVDPDDLVEPGALAALRAIVQQHSPDWVMCDFRAFDDASGQARRAHDAHRSTFSGPQDCMSGDIDLLIRGLFQVGRLHPWSKIVRREIWPTALRFPFGRVFEDLAVFPRLALQARNFYYAPQVWIAYRQRAGSTLATLSATRLGDWMAALVGYGEQLRAAEHKISEETAFVVAHYSARAFVRACKRGIKLAGPHAALAQFADRWRASSPLNAAALLRAYLRRGRVWRALQLSHWLRRAERQHRQSASSSAS
jgi:glycosyltransferase involved in cell wall biosynthesis